MALLQGTCQLFLHVRSLFSTQHLLSRVSLDINSTLLTNLLSIIKVLYRKVHAGRIVPLIKTWRRYENIILARLIFYTAYTQYLDRPLLSLDLWWKCKCVYRSVLYWRKKTNPRDEFQIHSNWRFAHIVPKRESDNPICFLGYVTQDQKSSFS